MLIRLLEQLARHFRGPMPALALAAAQPAARIPATRAAVAELASKLWDGLLLVPKRRTQVHKIWSRRYGNENWAMGLKLWKPKNHIVTCSECGSFHQLHTICRSCYLKVEAETKAVLERIRGAWKSDAIDKEVEVVYQGETAKSVGKRVVEVERERPLWFAPNLVHKANKPKPIEGAPREALDLEVKFK